MTNRSQSIFTLLRQAIKGEEQNFTEGSINRAIFLLSVPMVLEMAMESLLAVVDVFYVSQLHDNDAVATIGLTESVMTLIYSIAFGGSMGVTAIVARQSGPAQSSGFVPIVSPAPLPSPVRSLRDLIYR